MPYTKFGVLLLRLNLVNMTQNGISEETKTSELLNKFTEKEGKLTTLCRIQQLNLFRKVNYVKMKFDFDVSTHMESEYSHGNYVSG